jgi:hypothetical protein
LLSFCHMFDVSIDSLVFNNFEDSFNFFFDLLVVFGNLTLYAITHNVVKVDYLFQN